MSEDRVPEEVDKKFKDFVVLHNYARRIGGAETHWYFVEGEKAFRYELYIAATLSFLNGIEASLRTMLMYKREGYGQAGIDSKTISHGLLLEARKAGMNVGVLAFPGEDDFEKNLNNGQRNVEIVRNRHNICHGNLFEHFQEIPETGVRILTPECLRPVATIIREIADNWSSEIERFRLGHEL